MKERNENANRALCDRGLDLFNEHIVFEIKINNKTTIERALNYFKAVDVGMKELPMKSMSACTKEHFFF